MYIGAAHAIMTSFSSAQITFGNLQTCFDYVDNTPRTQRM